MIKDIYLRNPYTEVIKINAIGDCDFKLRLNGNIYYTRQEVIEKINSVQKLNVNEDEIARIGRWISSICANVDLRQVSSIEEGNIFQMLNSYSDGVCSSIAQYVYSFFSLVYPEHYCNIVYGRRDGGNGHQWNAFSDSHFDQINKMPNYKDYYVGCNLAEIHADKFFYIEPLRNFVNTHNTQALYTDYFESTVPAVRIQDAEIVNPIDNLKMKLPNGSNFIFPVKSTDDVTNEANRPIYNIGVALCTFPNSVVGLVEMPLTLITIKGTGSVKIESTTYNLPDDEAAIKTLLQNTPNPGGLYSTTAIWYHDFEIITNTDGITCEFMVNRKTWLLYNRNIINYEMTTGSLSFERYTPANPLDTAILSINQKASSGWTLNYSKYFYKNKSHPIPCATIYNDEKIISYLADSENKRPLSQFTNAHVKDAVVQFTAGSNVIDQCFSALLNPRVGTFASTLELSFDSVDGSFVYYTLDGSVPSSSKTLYTAPFTISATTTVKWINIRTDYADSHINSRVITKT